MNLAKFLFCFLIATSAVFIHCLQPRREASTIAALKSLKPDSEMLDKEYEIKAFFISNPIPLLVTDLKWARINLHMPDSVFMPISGAGAEAMQAEPGKYHGAEVTVRGRLRLMPQKENPEIFEYGFACGNALQINQAPAPGFEFPEPFDICAKYPPICEPGYTFFPEKVAMLYGGGGYQGGCYDSDWNDMVFMYKTLTSKYGYAPDNVIVLYKDGHALNNAMPVSYDASGFSLSKAIIDVKKRITGKPNNQVTIFLTGEGGGYLGTTTAGFPPGYYGGMDDWDLDEPEVTHNLDETLFFYGKGFITDDYFAMMTECIGAAQLIMINQQHFGGGFLHDMRGSNRINISSSSEFEFSWYGGPGNHDVFSYYFTSALNRADAFGNPVNADTDHNGTISLLEAFLYAKTNDTTVEHPQLDDDGDGVSSNSPSNAGPDGILASKTHL